MLAHEAERILNVVDVGRPAGLYVGPHGHLVMSVLGEDAFRVVDPSDGSVSTVRLGDVAPSPTPQPFGWVGDTLWAPDWYHSRIVYFDRDWNQVGETELFLPGRQGGIRGTGILARLPDGRLVARTGASTLSMVVAHPGGVGRTEDSRPLGSPSDTIADLPLWVTSPDGRVLDTLALISTRNSAASYRFPVVRGDGRRTTGIEGSQLFRDNPLYAVSADGSHLVIVDRWVNEAAPRPAYTVHRMTLEGDTVLRVSQEYDPIPLSEEVASAELRRIGDFFTQDPAVGLEVARMGMYLPPWLPPVSRVLVDSDGWIWIGRAHAPGTPSRRWDVLDPSGERVGAVLLPAILSVRAVKGLEAWALESAAEGGAHLWLIRASSP